MTVVGDYPRHRAARPTVGEHRCAIRFENDPRAERVADVVRHDAGIAALARNKQWQTEYRSARLLWLAGFAVEFPCGTYWLRRFANVNVRPPPEST